MEGDPRCQEYTICTAVAPDSVFTIRTYGTRQLCGPRLVCKLSSHEPRTCKSQHRVCAGPGTVSQLGLEKVDGGDQRARPMANGGPAASRR